MQRHSLSLSIRLVMSFLVAVLALGALPSVSDASTHINVGAGVSMTTPDVGAATPYPGTITISGMEGVIHQFFVAINVTHANPDDLDVLLVGPTGAKVVLMSDVGGTGDLTNRFFTLNTNSPGIAIPDGGPINQNAFYRATNVGSRDPFPAPAPGGVRSASTAVFLGTNPNGNWQVFVVDDTAGGGVGTINVQFGMTTSITRVNGAAISIPTSSAPGSLYPSIINMPYMAGTISFIDASLLNVTHTKPNDLDVLLVSPSGVKVRLMSDAGGNQNISNVTLRFSDITETKLPNGDGIVSGTYNASNYGLGDDNFPSPAPSDPYGNDMEDFVGEHAQGAWRLFVSDDGNGDGGSIGGWSLRLATFDSAPIVTTIGPKSVREGDSLEFDVTATDAEADPITLNTENLPAFGTFVDNGNGNGTFIFTPESGDVGVYPTVRIKATDGDLTSSRNFTLTVTDGTPPVTTATLDPPANAEGWNRTTVTVNLDAVDPPPGATGVASITRGATGANPIAVASIPGDSASVQVSAEGSTIVGFVALDNALNFEDLKQQEVKLDKTRPTATAPVAKLFANVAAADPDSARVNLSWTGTDNLSGVDRFQLQRSFDGGAFTNVTLPTGFITSVTIDLLPGTHVFRARAIDNAGNFGTFVASAPLTIEEQQEDSADIAYVGTWTTAPVAGAFGGALAFADAANATATLTFTGTSVAWVSLPRVNRGIAEVRLDGNLLATVDLFNATPQLRRVVFARNNLTNTVHTLEIRVLGTQNPNATDNRVDLDGFVVLRP